MNSLRPGKESEQLPVGTLVFRIGRKAYLSPAALEKKKALPEMFKLSQQDKDSPGMRLSIWVEELTIADQAWDFTGKDPEKTVVACLDIDRIKGIPAPDGFTGLRVEWEQAVIKDDSGKEVPNTRPGAEGYAGIAGLNQGGAKNKTGSGPFDN